MQRFGAIIKHINNKNRRKPMAQTETYKATVKGVKDIHDEENPVKYWLSVEMENGMDRRLYVDQNCRHIQKGQQVTVTGYPIKKPGSNNQTCVKIETEEGADAGVDCCRCSSSSSSSKTLLKSNDAIFIYPYLVLLQT